MTLVHDSPPGQVGGSEPQRLVCGTSHWQLPQSVWPEQFDCERSRTHRPPAWAMPPAQIWPAMSAVISGMGVQSQTSVPSQGVQTVQRGGGGKQGVETVAPQPASLSCSAVGGKQ